MSLKEDQWLFTELVAKLIQQAYQMGYKLSLGEAWRSPEEAARLAAAGKGIKRSLHCERLAIDINLFRHGYYQPATKAYRDLGEWWEKQHAYCKWGGHFGDGNHFSFSRCPRRA